MKTLFYSIIFIFIIWGHLNCFSQSGFVEVSLKEIEFQDNRIDSLLHDVLQKIGGYGEPNLLLYMIKKESDYHITISTGGGLDYMYSLAKFKVLGFCTINNQDVFIINRFYPQKMKFVDNTKNFLFSDYWIKNKNSYPPPPPPLSNPTYFYFLLKKNGNVLDLTREICY